MKRFFKIFLVSALIIGLFPAATSKAQSSTPPEELGNPEIYHIPSGPPNLESVISQLIFIYETEGLDAATAFGLQRGMVLDGDQVQVVLESTSEIDLDAIGTAVLQAGGELQSSYQNLQQAMVPITALQTFAEHSDIQYIREPRRPEIMEPHLVGTQTTEGVTASNAASWHSNVTVPRDGSGVSVAIIDGGFSGYASLLGTDLPATVTTRDYTGTFPGTSPHGTACAEIVYDMAPGITTMYLVKIGTNVDLGDAITWLISQNVQVISMSLGWTLDGPGDGTGSLASMVQNARDNGIFFATAAGNNRENMWSGTYNDNGGWHDWSGAGQQLNYFGDGTGSAWIIPAGTTISVGLHWDDWAGNPTQNYDLELYYFNTTTTSWTYVTGSYNLQNGGAGQTPEEFISVVAPATEPYGMIVWDSGTTRSGCIRLVTSHALPDIDERVTSRTLVFPADSPDAMTVAAVDVTTYAQEFYSSEGPTFGTGGTCTSGSTKPDISGYANVSSVSYGAGGFNGTSAATPHIAGAAALFIEAYTATTGGGTPPTPDQVQTYLESYATDLGTAGKDTLFGSGGLMLGGLTPTAIKLQTLDIRSDAVIPGSMLAFTTMIIVITSGLIWRKRKSN